MYVVYVHVPCFSMCHESKQSETKNGHLYSCIDMMQSVVTIWNLNDQVPVRLKPLVDEY